MRAITFLYAFTALCYLVSSQALALSAGATAEIVSIKGEGDFRLTDEKPWQAARIEQNLFTGNFVRTGTYGRMGLLFEDRTQIRLNQKAILLIKGKGKGGQTLIRLNRGRAWSQTKTLPRGLIMETPSATAAIRGTDWELDVADDGTSLLTVLSGQIEFYNDYGKVIVNKNEQARAEVGKAPVKLIIVQPENRIQWVSSYSVEPLRHIIFSSGSNDALALLDERKWQAAKKAIKATSGNNNISSSVAMGYVHLFDGKPEEALSVFTALKGNGQLNELIQLGMAASYIQQEKLADAVRLLTQSINKDSSKQSAAYLILSDIHMYDGMPDVAIEYLKKALLKFPEDPKVYSQLSSIYLITNKTEKSFANIRKALTKDSASYDAKLALGEYSRIQGQPAEAKRAYNDAITSKGADSRAWFGLGSVNTEREEVKQARINLAEAIKLEPGGAGYQGERGTLETFTNNFDEAEKAFDSALKNNRSDYVALTGNGLLELKRGNTQKALDYFLKASLLEPRYARAHVYAGVAYYQLGYTRQATEELQRASEIDNKDPLPHLLISIIETDLLNPSEAIISARKALELLPYLKSLNQVVNDQQGTANLGQAFAFMGLEEWAQSYAQQSYSPYWAGSHLFLADRYNGLYTKNSELFQGYISDPSVFGASNRFQTLLPKPGHYGNVSYRATTSKEFDGVSPQVEFNGLINETVPFSYYLSFEGFDLDFDDGPFETKTYTAALGLQPNHNISLFMFSDRSYLDTELNNSIANLDQNLESDRFDFGVNLKLAPTSQVWIKASNFASVDRIKGVLTGSPIRSATDVDNPEFGIRYTSNINDAHELTVGLDMSDRTTDSIFDFDDVFLGFPVVITTDLDFREKSKDIYISDRYKVTPNLLIQADLFYQQHNRNLDEVGSLFVPAFNLTLPITNSSENLSRTKINPRIGIEYKLDNELLVRAAYQEWQRPAGFSTLSNVATAGIPLDDRLVSRGGQLKRLKAQLEWEASDATFVSAHVDYKEIDNNLFSFIPFTVSEIESLNKLRQRDFGSLARDDLLEFINTPDYESGRIRNVGVSVNHALNNNWGLFGRYIHTDSKNTSNTFGGNKVPFLPEHTFAVGSTWTNSNGWYFINRLVYRNTRFMNEANTSRLRASWDGAFDLYKESKNKNWLVRFSVDDMLDLNQHTQYTAEINFRF